MDLLRANARVGSAASRKELARMFGFADVAETVPEAKGVYKAGKYASVLAQAILEIDQMERLKQVAGTNGNDAVADRFQTRLERMKLRLRSLGYFGRKDLSAPIVVYEGDSCPLGSGMFGATDENGNDAEPAMMEVPDDYNGLPINDTCTEDGSLSMNVYIQKGGVLHRCYPKHCFVSLGATLDKNGEVINTSEKSLQTLTSLFEKAARDNLTTKGTTSELTTQEKALKQYLDEVNPNPVNEEAKQQIAAVKAVSAEKLGEVQYPVLEKSYRAGTLEKIFIGKQFKSKTEAKDATKRLILATREAAKIMQRHPNMDDVNDRSIAEAEKIRWNQQNGADESILELVPVKKAGKTTHLVIPSIALKKKTKSAADNEVATAIMDSWYRTMYPKVVKDVSAVVNRKDITTDLADFV